MEDPLALDIPEEVKLEDEHFTHTNHREETELYNYEKPSHNFVISEEPKIQNKSEYLTNQSYNNIIYHCPSCDFSSTHLLLIKEHDKNSHILNTKPNGLVRSMLKPTENNVGSVSSISSFIKVKPLYKLETLNTNSKPKIKFKCALCKNNFLDKDECAEHMKTHNEKRKFTCKTCGFLAPNGPHLQEHIREHHIQHHGMDNNEIYIDVSSVVKPKNVLQNNIQVNLIPNKRTSLGSIKSFKDDLRSALSRIKPPPHRINISTLAGEQKQVELFVDPRSSSQDSEVKEILREEVETMEIDFRDQVDLTHSVVVKEVEMKSVRRVGNAMCSQCGFKGQDGSGMTLNTLERHWYRMHYKKENLYRCGVLQCSKVFDSIESKNIHKANMHTRRTHVRTKEEALVLVSVPQRNELADKIKSLIVEKAIGGSKEWMCTICGKVTVHKIDIAQHIKTNHIEGILHPCNFCGNLSRNINALKTHIQMHHEPKNSYTKTSESKY